MSLFFFGWRTLYIGTETHFISWNISDGKVLKIKKEESPIKAIRNDTQISIKDNMEIILFNKFEEQKNK
jgi:hypothetical protein